MAALASVALGNLYFFIVATFGMGVLMVLDPIVAQAIGAKDHEHRSLTTVHLLQVWSS